MLPQFMEFNLTSASGKYVQIARLLGEDTSEISVLEAAIKAVEKVRFFVEDFNLPHKLNDLGFEEINTDEVWSIFSRFEETNHLPRAIGKGELQTILEQSL